MADKEVIVGIKTEIEGARKDLETVKQGVNDIGKASEDTAKATGSISKGLKGVGVAIKAAGIGLALKAFEMLSEIFMKNQKTADFFATAFETVSIAFNDFINFIFNNAGGVVDFFKDIFENPLDNIKSLGKAIKDNLIERFNSLIEASGFLADAMLKVFRGDFKGAVDSAKEAGKEFVDVLTGVDDSTTKIADSVTKAAKATADYVVSTVKAAGANVELSKAAEIAAVQVQGLIEKYDRQAESLRQVRDDETKTFAERIQANKDLAVVLEEQMEQMLALRNIELQAAQTEFNKLQNQENLIALLEAKNEVAAVEAQITGFQSEQLTNQVSLERELQETKNELFIQGLDQREREIAETNQHYDELVKMAKKAGEDITAIETQRSMALRELNKAELDQRLSTYSTMAGQVADIAGRDTAFGKAAAVAQATINTYQGATKALASLPPPFGQIASALTVMQGLMQVQSIVNTPTPTYAQGGIVGGTGSGTSDSVSARLSKGESVINAKSTRMFRPLLSAINEAGGGTAFADSGTIEGGTMGVTGGTVKAYVVADEMSNSQDRLSKIRRRATI